VSIFNSCNSFVFVLTILSDRPVVPVPAPAPAPDPLVWTGPQHINLIQPDPAISFDVGTAYLTGPLSYSQTTTLNGDTLFIYQPGTDAQKMIAYNASTGYWVDWNLQNAPSVVYQTQARLVAWKVGTVVYFVFDSPFPITGDSPAQILQPNSTRSTDQSGVAAASILNIIDGPWGPGGLLAAGMWFTLDSTSTADLFIYYLTSDQGGSTAHNMTIQYTPSIDTWADHGTGDPHGAFSTSINALDKRLITTDDALFTFEDPYY
jgi:hypothetical protein